MSRMNYEVMRRSTASLLVFLTSLMLLVACGAGMDPLGQNTHTNNSTTATAVAVVPTPTLAAPLTADATSVDHFIALFEAAEATVVNNGNTEQGVFPVDDVQLWHLAINGTDVHVFEFPDATARQAVSDNISPTGYEYTVANGDSTVKTHWDGEGFPHFWTLDNLIANYWGEEPTVISLLNKVLGPPFADGSQPYRPEPYSGAIAGIGEYGVSFQYDPYLAVGIETEVNDAFADDNGMNYLLLPQHLAFIFSNSYADADQLFQRQQLNLETMPQIVVYPAADYAATHPLAKAQIDQLRVLLGEKPSVPGGTMPYLPLNNAAQVFHSKLAYLEFTNGSGVRYVTAFSQDASPTTNQHLLYTFQGLTDDGGYYVAAFFPITTAVLPDTIQVDDWEAFNLNYATYVAETKAMLNELSPLDFTPDLALLDTVVTSLQVEPNVDLSGVEKAVSPVELGRRQPIGVYQVYDSDTGLYRLYRVEMDGSPKQVAEQRHPLLPSPDAAHAIYMDDERRLWLIDLADGNERQLAEGTDLSPFYLWGDSRTLLLGVLLPAATSEALYDSHLAALDIESGKPKLIEEDYVSLGRPAMAPDGQSIAYDISIFETDGTTGRIYQPDTGSRPLDPAQFAGLEGEESCDLYNPAWSPDGRQLAWLCRAEGGFHLVVFDLARGTAMTVFTWQPAQFGALPPSPVWSPDGKWLAIEIWANNEDETGLWVLPADGTLARLHVPTGHEPLWLNPSQLIYADLDENMNGDIKLIDLDTGDVGVLDLPAGTTLQLLYY